MYNHNLIEKKWQKYWEDNKTYQFKDTNKEKFYVLDMFPYPSGKGLHVGHPKGYTATDVISRYKRLKGFDVLHPIGWDAFGLPAEQYALETNNHPASFTKTNIEKFRLQLKALGFDYDYKKEINTTDPDYFKWTQWIFIQLYKNGLAEIKNVNVNWCPYLGTVLANEEVVNNSKGEAVSERGGHLVEKRPMRQWVLKITKYADKLLDGLEDIDWSESLKSLQRNWIGKSEGANIKFAIKNTKHKLEIFTTRPDTLFGVSYLVLAPEHELVLKIVGAKQFNSVEKYIAASKNRSDRERMTNKIKTGVYLGVDAINPINGDIIPIWISDYVLNDFATGAVMAVPAHDTRDFEFANKFNLPIKWIIECQNHDSAFIGNGKHINSEIINDLENTEAIKIMLDFIIKNKYGNIKTNFKLRDWLFSRQRYWGEPFPIIFDNDKITIVDDLPVCLPDCDDFKPDKTGKPPLAKNKQWYEIKEGNKTFYREANTMPQWAGSSWYYLGYILKNEDGSYTDLNSKEAMKRFKKWLPVDIYIGGQEHAVLHLLYARFWHHFLFDIGVVPNKEPFMKVINQGMIQDKDGDKMSKSKGNIINPDDIIRSHGADALRLYECFMGPLTASLPWNDNGMDGMRKWLDRVYRLFDEHKEKINDSTSNEELTFAYHNFVANLDKNLNNQQFNIGISNMMIFINACYKAPSINKSYLANFLKILSCFAPHISEELYSRLGNTTSVTQSNFPSFDSSKLKLSNVTIAVQINGKLRDTITVERDTPKDELLKIAKSTLKIRNFLQKKYIIKEIVIINKIINIVIK